MTRAAYAVQPHLGARSAAARWGKNRRPSDIDTGSSAPVCDGWRLRLHGRRVRVKRASCARKLTAAYGSCSLVRLPNQVSSSEYRFRLCASRCTFLTQLGEVEIWQPEP